MMAILVQTGLKKVVIEKKSENLNQSEWEELDEKALSAIQFASQIGFRLTMKIKLCCYCILYPLYTSLSGRL
ncbi:hypothetical protein Gotri_028074 [Gossypium trilobum]|uniref:Uncharacterized protein n=1 Tax=Gossypium trilobum TaxID=34281 RepID=A0A7J9FMG2_9ROSI|nr:hypothetical protein [Gossypium trilobum]